ncbi:MAG TPA: hypothetical protein PLV21_06455 [Cyclobacteriaceae bacterium]|nr:hypothetical protein [Cyclobacteriaceae bacterium]HRJ81503.1 hypothetical protein [Cyclobacteriaceae bacterium]
MDNIYEVGSFIAAQENPNCRLRIYYCQPVDDPTHKVLAFYERELIPPSVAIPLL